MREPAQPASRPEADEGEKTIEHYLERGVKFIVALSEQVVRVANLLLVAIAITIAAAQSGSAFLGALGKILLFGTCLMATATALMPVFPVLDRIPAKHGLRHVATWITGMGLLVLWGFLFLEISQAVTAVVNAALAPA